MLASASNRVSEDGVIWVPLHFQSHRSDGRGESARKLSMTDTQIPHLADASWSVDPSNRVIHPLPTCKTPQCTPERLMGISKDDTLESSTIFELELRRYIMTFCRMTSLSAISVGLASSAAFTLKNEVASAGDVAF